MTTDLDNVIAIVTRQAQADVEPVLSTGDIEDIVASTAKAVVWSANTPVTYGQLLAPTVRNGFLYRVTIGGTTGATEPPLWPQHFGRRVYDGTAQLAGYTPDTGASLYDAQAATYQAWLQKAAMCSDYIAASKDTTSAHPEQIYEHCMAMAKQYTPVGVA